MRCKVVQFWCCLSLYLWFASASSRGRVYSRDVICDAHLLRQDCRSGHRALSCLNKFFCAANIETYLCQIPCIVSNKSGVYCFVSIVSTPRSKSLYPGTRLVPLYFAVTSLDHCARNTERLHGDDGCQQQPRNARVRIEVC